MGEKAITTLDRLRTRAEHLSFRAVGALVRALPLPLASRTGAFAWRWLAPFNKRHKRALHNLERAFPERDAAWREAVLTRMWSNLGATFAEGFALGRLLDSPDRFDIALSPEVEAALADRRGNVVLASLHTGNWEVAVLPLVWRGLEPSGIYQKVRNPLVDSDIRAARLRLYPGGLLPKGSQTARAVLRNVRGGGMVSIMADLRDRQGVSVPFFGRPAPSTLFPALVARTSKVPLIAGRVVRLGPARFRIEAEIVEMPITNDRAADMEDATRRLHALFERWVREHPDQWMWGHRRWGAVAVRSERRSEQN